MKRFLFGVLWLAALLALGAVLGQRFIPHGYRLAPVYLGAAIGGIIFLTLAGLGWLPGARPRSGTPVAWGWRQAVWLLVQFANMQIAAQIICMVLIIAGGILLARLTHTAPASGFGGGRLVIATVGGYLGAALWSFWYISRLGPARLREGGPTGIGWCAAPPQAYLAAIAGLVVVGLASALLQHIVPPPPDAMKHDAIAQIFGTHGWKVAVLFVLAAGVAPFTEELVFRGGIFSALAGPFGALWAAVITSVLFTAAHAGEFVFYLPGLVVIGGVALVLIWLRVRYRSIRPGILLHILFNGLSILAVTFSH